MPLPSEGLTVPVSALPARIVRVQLWCNYVAYLLRTGSARDLNAWDDFVSCPWRVD
jgi:hypothetical protein